MSTIGRYNGAIYRNIQMLLSNKLSDMAIGSGQYDFFYVISLREGISQKALSEHLYISKSTTAKAVKSLVAKGYVEKRKDGQDSRMDHLYLTERGREMAPAVSRIFNENLEIASRGFSEEELAQLLHLMSRVLHNLIEENEGEGAGMHE